jgi:hypothetical protein
MSMRSSRGPEMRGHVALDEGWRAGAFVLWISEVAAGTRVERTGEHELGGIGEGGRCTGDRDKAIFDWLAQYLEDIFLEFREFVEEEDAVVGERDLSRAWIGTASDESRIRNGVMG